MYYLTRWVMPVSFVGIGIAILSGLVLTNIPNGTGLRMICGVVVILLGVHRFVAARTSAIRRDRRRFGGERARPWEGENHEK